MALPDFVKWSSASTKTTGISGASVAAGANYLGTEIDNTVDLDTYCDIEIVANFSVAPTANKVILLYLIYSLDGINYEDGSTTVDPTKSPIGVLVTRNVAGDQRVIINDVPISPHKFKVLVNNDSDQSCTITVSLYTKNIKVID